MYILDVLFSRRNENARESIVVWYRFIIKLLRVIARPTRQQHYNIAPLLSLCLHCAYNRVQLRECRRTMYVT